MNNGDVVFFKKAKKSTHRKAVEVGFKGHAFGVLLGHVPPFAKDPPPEQLIRLMGTIGFVTFDDVAEFLGDEFGAKTVAAFEAKYYTKVDEAAGTPPSPATNEPPVGSVEPSGLIDSNGAPLGKMAEVPQPEGGQNHDA